MPGSWPTDAKCGCVDILAELRQELTALRGEVARLADLVEQRPPAPPAGRSWSADPARASADDRSAGLAQERVTLYRSLFAGREDVYAQRWERDGKPGWSPKYELHPGQTWQQARDAHQYRPLTDQILGDPLAGGATIGLYPLLPDGTCRLLTCDFDGQQWQLDAQAYAHAAAAAGVPVAVEISRSGNGAHVWMFISEPVSAQDARIIGFGLLREAMAVRGELGLDSYDRFFPAQDELPSRGSLGNLIALPLQGRCRRAGTTVFADPDTFHAYPDQWAFLASLGRLTPADVRRLAGELGPVAVGPEARWFRSSLRREPPPPAVVYAQWGAMLAVRRSGLPPSLLASLKHAASMANPTFYKNENLRLSNWNTPRFVRCYLEDLEFIYLPRAMVDTARTLISEAGSRLEITDRRADPAPISVRFVGALRDTQPAAVAALARHDHGVLQAPPGSGKTVMGCALLAHHQVPTLVLVDRAPLLEQWRDRIAATLDLDPAQVGQIGGGKTKPTGIIDLAMMQTVARMDDAAEKLGGYGLVIVDEAHHAGAPTVEKAVRRIPARRWLGLTATAYRRDGLDPIIFMHCGPMRHTIPIVDTGDPGRVRRSLHVHHTGFALPDEVDVAKPGAITGVVFAALAGDEPRNAQVCADVHAALSRGRNCLVLTRQTKHVELLAGLLRAHGHQPYTLYATRKTKELKAALQLLSDPPDGGPPLLVIATDRYVGEGYDCPQLDTLFLAHPVAFKGSMVQYVGRVLRSHPGKTEIEVHDYVDAQVGVLAAMWRKRSKSYAQLGFTAVALPDDAPAAGTSASRPGAAVALPGL